MAITDSILTSTKKILQIEEDYTYYDLDIITHINSVFANLHQLGIGPIDGFEIADKDATWASYLEGNLNLNLVKTYMYLRVRLLFDPPQTSYLIASLKEQIEKLEWQINVQREGEMWDPPVL